MLFGEFTVLNESIVENRQTKWLCKCSCGKEVYVNGSSLRRGVSKSCGHNRTLPSRFEPPYGFKSYKLSKGFIYVDENGNVFSTKTGKFLKPSLNKKGYLQISFYSDDGRVTRKVHRIVAETFIDYPDEKPTVNHIDGDKANNAVSNLEWATYSENQQHAYDTGLCVRGIK